MSPQQLNKAGYTGGLLRLGVFAMSSKYGSYDIGIRAGSHIFSNSEHVPRLAPLMMRPPGSRGRSAAGDAGAPEVFDMALDSRGVWGVQD